MSMNLTGRVLGRTGSCMEPGYIQCHIAMWILRTVPFGLLCFGTCGNTLSLIILWRRSMRKFSTTVYLSFLAVTDMTLLWASIVRNLVVFVSDTDLRDISEFHCVANTYIVLTSGSISVWILTMLTFERTMFTKYPTMAKLKMTRKFAFRLCSATVVIIALVHGHFLFTSRHSTVPGSNVTECTYVGTKGMLQFIDKVWPTAGFLLFTLIPVCIISTGNFIIICTLRRQRRRIQTAASANIVQTASQRNTTGAKLVVVLSCFFLATMLPYSAYQITYRLMYPTLTPSQFAWFQLAYATIMTLMWSNFSFNFVLYFVIGSLFKKEWTILVQRGKSKLLWCFARGGPRVHPLQSVSSSLKTRSQASTSNQGTSRNTYV